MKKIPQKKKSVEDAARTAALDLLGHNTPAIIPLIHYTGIERDLIAGGGGGAAVVRFAHLGNAGHGVGPGAELGSKSDGVARVQRMDFAEMVCHPAIMPSQTDVARPNAGVGEVACALGKLGAARPLVDFDVYAQGRDFQRPQVAPGVIEIGRNLRVGSGLRGGVAELACTAAQQDNRCS